MEIPWILESTQSLQQTQHQLDSHHGSQPIPKISKLGFQERNRFLIIQKQKKIV